MLIYTIYGIYMKRGCIFTSSKQSHNTNHLKIITMKNATSTSVNVYGLKTSRNFENKVASLINDHLTYYGLNQASEIYVSDITMSLASGHGQYKQCVIIEIDDHKFELKRHSTDSVDYDFFNNDDVNEVTMSNALKNLALDIIDDKREIITEVFFHADEEE